jgi:hypothetical protein
LDEEADLSQVLALAVLAGNGAEVVAGTGEVNFDVGADEPELVPPVLAMPPVTVADDVGEVLTVFPVEAMELVGEVFTIAPVEVAGVDGDEVLLVDEVGGLVYLLLEAGPQLKLIEWTPS